MADSTAIKFYNPAEKFRPKSEASPSTSGRINGEAAFDTVKADTVFFNGTAFYGAKDAEINAKSYADTEIESAIDTALTTIWKDKGNYDASSSKYPTTGGSGDAGAIMEHDLFTVGTAGNDLLAGWIVRAQSDTPGQTDGNWSVDKVGYGYTPENAANKQTDLTASATKYPVVDAVNTGLALRALNLLTGYSSGAGAVAATDTVLEGIQKLNGNVALKATDIIAGYSKGAGTVANDDTLKAAIQKLDGNLDNKHGYYKDDTVEAGDWSGSGPYTLTIASATHGLTTVFGVHFWETSGTDKILRDSVSRKVDTNNAVIFSSDTALAGRAIVTGI
jgi:hypothetical protein